ncbi:Os04g0609400 [Oryza sativa Japonica Group]|uniref:Os04g0609400 protein n=1 Tax=Oryza sativa subsp. japonica TaxID=39947 RepID=A0A0P0WEN2_ORYSJ|nr:hypothetical protein EE612_025452 [Oryza sativa]BAS90933.1 Os04g0609400 [Oryza sativa Japonica Group]
MAPSRRRRVRPSTTTPMQHERRWRGGDAAALAWSCQRWAVNASSLVRPGPAAACSAATSAAATRKMRLTAAAAASGAEDGGAGTQLTGTKSLSESASGHGGAGLVGARKDRSKDGAGAAELPRAAAAQATRNMLKE